MATLPLLALAQCIYLTTTTLPNALSSSPLSFDPSFCFGIIMSGGPLLRAAILIISETASRDSSTDKGIPAIQQTFAEKGGDQWQADETRIVTDNVLDIQHAITTWTDGADPVNLVVTSGGTGFAQKDVTPEVTFDPCTTVQQ